MARTECYAVPGAHSVIDTIREDGLTFCMGHTEAEVLARYPGAVRMTQAAWHEAQVALQAAEPLVWEPTTEEQYTESLEVLPPAYWHDGVFCVGEPMDHSYATGRPRFTTYREIHGAYTVASRPMTIAEVKELP